MLNHKGIQNRLALFLSKIDLDKMNSIDCLEFFRCDGKKDKKDVIVQFFIDAINSELTLLTDPLRANKKYLNDVKRLNKLQKEIIEKYYFNDTFLNFFRRLGIKDELITSGQNEDYVTICLLLSRMLRASYIMGDIKLNNMLIKELFGVEPTSKGDEKLILIDFKDGFLNDNNTIPLITLLENYAITTTNTEPLCSNTRYNLELLNDTFNLGLKYEISRNEFQNAIKEEYGAFLQHTKEKTFTNID